MFSKANFSGKVSNLAKVKNGSNFIFRDFLKFKIIKFTHRILNGNDARND
jgi:hypothetical protein